MEIRFTLSYHSEWGQEVSILGEIPELGAWDPGAAQSMSYTAGDRWTAAISLAGDGPVTFGYKYVVKGEGSRVIREETGVRTFRNDSSGGGALRSRYDRCVE